MVDLQEKPIGFNTKSWSNDWDDLKGSPFFFGKPQIRWTSCHVDAKCRFFMCWFCRLFMCSFPFVFPKDAPSHIRRLQIPILSALKTWSVSPTTRTSSALMRLQEFGGWLRHYIYLFDHQQWNMGFSHKNLHSSGNFLLPRLNTKE